MKKENITKIIEVMESATAKFKAILEDEMSNCVETKEETVKPNKKTTKEAVDTKEETEEVTKETLDEMSYNDLKAFAKELGVKAVGNRNKITELILKAVSEGNSISDEVEEDVEETVEETPEEKSKKPAPAKSKKQPESVEEEESEDLEDEEEDDELSEIKSQLEEMEVEELANICRDAGLSARGKKQSLITKILNGIEDGVIELDVSEDEEEEDDSVETENESEDNKALGLNDLDNPDMTEERAEAISELEKDIKANIKRKKLTTKDMEAELLEAGFTKKEIKSIDDITSFYIDYRAMFINDSGDEVENEEPYELNGYPACCGKLLEENEDGDYVCNVCGNIYEAE